jgi:hypothetical protein
MGATGDGERVAQCGCGRLRIRVRGHAQVVAVCHCDFCQKHTGSVFRVSSWFADDQVLDIIGDPKVYNGLEIHGVGLDGSDKDSTSFHFCGTCGSAVYWVTDVIPGFHGIAVASFVDPGFPLPTIENCTELRHDWVAPIQNAVAFEHFRSS